MREVSISEAAKAVDEEGIVEVKSGLDDAETLAAFFTDYFGRDAYVVKDRSMIFVVGH
jgi:hypothetical protein